MRRPSLRIVLVLVTWVPLWAACFWLAAQAIWEGVPFSSVYVAAPARPDAAPTVIGFRPWLETAGSDLAVGDRLLGVGDADLTGVGPLGLWVRVTEQRAEGGAIPVRFERDGRVREGRLAVGVHAAFWTYLPISLAFALVGMLVLWRAPASAASRAIFLAFLACAINYASNFGGSRATASVSVAVHLLSIALMAPLAVRAVSFFPDSRAPASRLGRAAPWALLLVGVFEASQLHATPLSPGLGFLGFGLSVGAAFLAVLVLGARAWRRADPVKRRQLKWFVLGLYLAALPNVFTVLLAGSDGARLPLYIASQLALVLIPAFLLISIARYNLFDIDRLLSAAASYNLALFGLAVTGLMVVPRVAEAGSRWLGVAAPTSSFALSLVLASVLVPAARRLRPWLDRRFFAERHALDRGMDALLDDLSRCADARQLVGTTGMRLHDLLRPESCVVYVRSGEVFEPVFAEGSGVPPLFEGRSPLVATLRRRREPLALSGRGRRGDTVALAPFDRAALAALSADVVVPIHRSDELAGFLCLGPKRSGDVYTPVDVMLLSAIGDKVSSELLRYDANQLAQESLAMRESLRRYVPGAVAEQIERGQAADVGECELSVLFVDLGIEEAPAGSDAEMFSRVNLANEAISAVVRRHGGSVVEFNGEVMMAVFGAPEALPEKERAAVEAAEEMDRLATQSAARFSVGIATGRAFVGSIRSADRAIWSAVGDTTNLAARLQALARELGVGVVIDARTRERAGLAAKSFRTHPDTAIRGRARREDLWVLPHGYAPAAA